MGVILPTCSCQEEKSDETKEVIFSSKLFTEEALIERNICKQKLNLEEKNIVNELIESFNITKLEEVMSNSSTQLNSKVSYIILLII